MFAEPQPEHQWLQRLVGEWTYETDAPTDAPAEGCSTWKGTESVRSLGGVWVVAEGQSTSVDGAAASNVMSIGFDPATKRYVGTWIGSMMTNLWVYDGELSADGNSLVLASEGPDMFAEGKTGLYHDIIEFTDDDHRLLRARIRKEDGTWHEFMVTRYQRTK
jgi:hypothetical protein